ncbi:agmatinase [Kineothrix alysoides]|uniref:Agmatinase n=1 Tax=Kineothrix alysoides TaxID=1469948 RepID=A0A4R1QM81_9FIRM|nr:agmatinase [Kineothrix alysoides]TCL54828.1 agmatinase [Kineothrix alysoides]
MLNKNIVNFIGCEAEYEEAKIVLFGSPFDSTTSYRPGTRFGPQAMRNESYGLETYSPYQDKDLLDCKVFDSGDLELPIGDTERVLAAIEERTETIIKDGKIPFMIGGEHLVTLGSVRAAARNYPDLHIVHFDAHADLREDYLGVKLSHACVLRRSWELLGDGRIHQFGIRSGDREEFEWAKEGHVAMRKFDFDNLTETVTRLRGKPVYFTIDLDVLDPSVFPGTGTPEAGGVSFLELLKAMLKTAKGCHIVGCDVNELSPAYDGSGVSTATAGKIVRELLLALS